MIWNEDTYMCFFNTIQLVPGQYIIKLPHTRYDRKYAFKWRQPTVKAAINAYIVAYPDLEVLFILGRVAHDENMSLNNYDNDNDN